MDLRSSQTETIRQGSEPVVAAQRRLRLGGSQMDDHQRGFTLIELVMVIVIAGILAVVVAPRMFDANVFKSRGFADQVQATLRYAQKAAIAQRRNVCVTLTASSITLMIATVPGTASSCTANLALPGGGSNSIPSPATGITMTYTSASFNFDGLGSTPAAQTITVSGGAPNSIVVEAQTGYVHSP
ncbi:MAG: General secretion pathway protein H [Candidatus Gallionella acididurans]|uniref:Type II secretion system protein H n=1 Tax=Candidatus Gallionella acididurans TaxID=1796491 RepID=A0A139BTI5_9PROT|nr:MAG: General secretion pathway protein H [Candidatus Gallionella acididurans]